MGELADLSAGEELSLPAPSLKGKVSLEEAIAARRSVRAYRPASLSLEVLSQLLWATQGITHPFGLAQGRPSGLRAAPSAGACYPIELYLACPEGLFHYIPEGHRLRKLSSADLRGKLASDPFVPQPFIAEAPAVFIFAVVKERTCRHYGSRGERYICMDVGHAAENLCLQAAALGLGSCAIGAFDDDYMTRTLSLGFAQDKSLPPGEQVIYLVTVGLPA